MKQEKLNAYSARITQANKSQLVVITYEIILDSLLFAREDWEIKDWLSFEKDVKRVQKLINELMGALNFQVQISLELMALYQFCGKCIVKAMCHKSCEEFSAIESVINRLKEAFVQVAKEDNSEPVMKNTQTIYAGLTYGKYSLNEVCVNVNEANRGFRA
ncbi:MAG: flagellar protein FliS [Velocimicrobium sp.]